MQNSTLNHIREAIEQTGLIADPKSLETHEQPILVTNRLAQTTIRYLTNRVDARVGEMLCQELLLLGGPQEMEILLEDTGFTYYHVVQFLYEFARQHVKADESDDFCYGMGLGGGGIEVAPHTEVISLIGLLITALDRAHDVDNVALLVREISPMFLGKIFSEELFRIEVEDKGPQSLGITLSYVDPDRLRTAFRPLGLERHTGRFFVNSALHIEGTLQLAWDTFADPSGPPIVMVPRIQHLDPEGREALTEACACSWDVTWSTDVKLQRHPGEEDVFARFRSIYEGLHMRDFDYYMERIKTLETRIRTLETETGFPEMLGDSTPMQRVFETIRNVSGSDLTVLVRGESGTGKELVARAIHARSGRNDRPFVAVNCAAFSEGVLESELFGHEKGAFTGAVQRKAGRFEMADGGTLFLDEVGDIPLTTQVKLLRVLETRTFERVGGTEPIQVDVRIIGATNRDLESMMSEGSFREDLFFRLDVLPVDLPPLRDRREDIPLLAQSFLETCSPASGKNVKGLSRGALDRLVDHPWPGNIRDLQNVIQRAVVVYSKGETLYEADVNMALGRDAHASAASDLNLRQREVLGAICNIGRCTIAELEAGLGEDLHGVATSRRTLQNDVRALTDKGHLAWHKQGSARSYSLTPAGKSYLDQIRT